MKTIIVLTLVITFLVFITIKIIKNIKSKNVDPPIPIDECRKYRVYNRSNENKVFNYINCSGLNEFENILSGEEKEIFAGIEPGSNIDFRIELVEE